MANRKEFWTDFINVYGQIDPSWKNRTAAKDTWMTKGGGSYQFTVSFRGHSRSQHPNVALQFYSSSVEQNEQLFTKLEEQKESIEQKWKAISKEDLTWASPKHGNMKSRCIKCDGSRLCIHCKYIIGTLRYVESLDKKVKCCARCFYHFYPSDQIPRRYKLKQHYFNEKLIEEFGDIFQYDKKIKCGCSKRRPDWFIDCFKYSIIIELDEDQHKYTSCDEKRMMELFQDLGNRKLVLIRINPDKYKEDGKTIKSCFTFSKTNTIKATTKNFNKRFNLLVEKIKYYIDNEPTKEITVEKLFFNS